MHFYLEIGHFRLMGRMKSGEKTFSLTDKRSKGCFHLSTREQDSVIVCISPGGQLFTGQSFNQSVIRSFGNQSVGRSFGHSAISQSVGQSVG